MKRHSRVIRCVVKLENPRDNQNHEYSNQKQDTKVVVTDNVINIIRVFLKLCGHYLFNITVNALMHILRYKNTLSYQLKSLSYLYFLYRMIFNSK